MGVKGYPTIKYFVGGDKKGKDYQGGRDFNSLKSFVETKLNKPMCDVETKKGCKPNEITFIEKHQDMSASELMDVLKQKAQELVKVKKDKSEAEKEFKAKEKELKKEEVKIQTATNLLRQLEKVAAKKAKSEL